MPKDTPQPTGRKPVVRRCVDFVKWRLIRGGIRVQRLWMTRRLNRDLARHGPRGLDPATRYPSYRSLDDLIDVERLRSLDGFMEDAVLEHLAEVGARDFDTGEMKLRWFDRTQPGSKVIELSSLREPDKPFSYFELDAPELWQPSENVARFGPLMEFIETLPFATTARMVILADPLGRPVTVHRDHYQADVLNEFIWFRTNLVKPLFFQSATSGERRPLEGHTAWFDTVNQFHGVAGTGKLSISVRVDGRFTEEFRARFPIAAGNRASTPALWASAV